MHFNHTLSFQFTVINSISGHILSFASYTLSLFLSMSPVLLPLPLCVACLFLSRLPFSLSCSHVALSLSPFVTFALMLLFTRHSFALLHFHLHVSVCLFLTLSLCLFTYPSHYGLVSSSPSHSPSPLVTSSPS